MFAEKFEDETGDVDESPQDKMRRHQLKRQKHSMMRDKVAAVLSDEPWVFGFSNVRCY